MILIRLILFSLLLALPASPAFAQGKGKGKGEAKGGADNEDVAIPDPSGGFTTTITAINGNRITYLKPDQGTSPMSGGKGKGKGRFGKTVSGPDETKILSERALITSATTTRRTGDMIVGIELGGGIRNQVFEKIDERGIPARLVIKEDQIVEINVLVSQEESEAPIAVKPKKPPTK